MIIPLTFPTPYSLHGHTLPPQLAKIGTDEIVLIEMQGALHVEGDASGQVAGRLCVVDDTKATFQVGHHILEGNIMKLPKPYAVLYKQGGALLPSSSKNTEGSPDTPTQHESEPVSYEIVAVVEKKICFNRRPLPAANKTAGTAKTNRIGDIDSSKSLGGVAKRKR